MKSPRLTLLVLSLLSCLSGSALKAGEAEVIPVAVLDLDATDSRLKERGSQIALLVTTKLSTIDGIVTVERQDLAKLLSEQELGASGMVDPSTAARIGHLTGARVLVTGRIFSVAGETTAAVKVMSTETGRVFGAAETFPAEAPPAPAADKLGVKIAELLLSKSSVLLAHPVTLEDRVARLKSKVAGRKPTTFAITIPEQHLGSAVIDPAAETEIALILGQLGFTRLSGEAEARADYRISGEAISEAGVRRGSLISCRARTEIKVATREGGKVVLTDRQTSFAVDTAEHIAAKLALQHSGADLAERIVDAISTNP